MNAGVRAGQTKQKKFQCFDIQIAYEKWSLRELEEFGFLI